MTELIDNPPPLPEPTYGLFSVKKLYTADQYRAGEAAAFARGVAVGRNAGLEEAVSRIKEIDDGDAPAYAHCRDEIRSMK